MKKKVVKKLKPKKNKARLVFLVPTASILSLLMVISIGSYWVQIANKYQEKKYLDRKMIELREKEDELQVDVNKLQDPDYIARYAREKYGFSKDGELILMFKNPNQETEK